MKLFLDTSNSKFIIALIDNNKVIDFSLKSTEKNVAKMANKWIEDFFQKNKININNISGLYTTIGPGSFTGTKVSLNIFKSFDLILNLDEFGYMNSLSLVQERKKKYVVFPMGKNRIIIKKNSVIPFVGYLKIKSKDFINKLNNQKITFGYESFDKEKLEKLFIDKKFKVVDNLNKINLIYLKSKIG